MSIAALALISVFIQALEPGGEGDGVTVRVVVVGNAPFVMDSDGVPSGLSIDVWNRVAAELGVRTEFDLADDIGASLDLVASGERDIAVGPISITPDRAEQVTFTQPYLNSSLAIVAPAAESLLDRFSPFLTQAFITGAFVLAGILVVVGSLLWLAERRVNMGFPTSTVSGVGNGIWMALVTMTTVGYGDRVPVTIPGRIITGVWMLASLVVASSLTAFLATALTLSQIPAPSIAGAEDLAGRRVGVVADTTSEPFARDFGARVVAWDDLTEAVEALARGDIDAVVFDRPILRFVLAERPNLDLQLSDASYQPQNYGFATAHESLLNREINLAILRLQDSGELARLEERWLGAR